MKHCQRCNLDFPKNRKFCEFCGSALINFTTASVSTTRCFKCNEPVEASWKFCKNCSARLVPPIQNLESSVSVQSAQRMPATVAVKRPVIPPAPTSTTAQTSVATPKLLIRCRSCRHVMEEDVAFCDACGANMMDGTSRSRSSVSVSVSAALPTHTQQDNAAESERLRLEQEQAKVAAQRREAQEREEAERQRLDREHAEKERLRIEQERVAEEERLRVETEFAEEAERAAEVERVRLEQERAAEGERLRLEQEKHAEAERLLLEQERTAEAERLRLEEEKVAEAERLRLEREREAEAERLRVEQENAAEAERLRREKEQAAEGERLRMEKERAEEEHLRHEQEKAAERVRLAEERAEQERVRIEQERSTRAERLRIERERSAEAEKRFEETWARPDIAEGVQTSELDSARTHQLTAQLDDVKRSQDAIRESRHADGHSSLVSVAQDGHSSQSAYLPSWAVTTEAPKKRGRWIVAALALIITVTVGVVVAMRFSRPRTPATAELKTNPPFVTPPNMVYVPGGEFVMGAEAGDEYEKPAHKVLVKPFFMDTYEVTCEDYDKFLKATGRKAPPGWLNGACAAGAARKPVTGVNWDDANAYAQWAKKRLPTEEEWEFAARGSDEWKYPWGKDWKQGQANANNASQGLADVGKFKARSPLGLADLIGNAWEWTSSSIHSYKGGQIAEDQLSEADRNKMKVIRGGCYLSNPQQATATYRRGWPPPNGPLDFNQTGFRCALDAPSKN